MLVTTARRRGRAVRVAMAGLALMPTFATALGLSVCVGLTSVLFITASTAIVQLRSDPMMRGRVLALQSMVFIGSTPIGGPLLGWICDQWGARAGIAVGAVAALAAGAWGLAMARRYRVDHVAAGDAHLDADLLAAEP